EQEVAVGAASENIANSAEQVSATFLLTDDDASFTGVSPRRPIGGQGGGIGAIELAARWSRLDVDDKAFPTFADPTASASRAEQVLGGVNWYLNRNAKVMLSYSVTSFDGGAPTGDRESERVLQTRFQLQY